MIWISASKKIDKLERRAPFFSGQLRVLVENPG
jgi:hypothetical protein